MSAIRTSTLASVVAVVSFTMSTCVRLYGNSSGAEAGEGDNKENEEEYSAAPAMMSTERTLSDKTMRVCTLNADTTLIFAYVDLRIPFSKSRNDYTAVPVTSIVGLWSSGYDASLTRKRSAVRVRPSPFSLITLQTMESLGMSC